VATKAPLARNVPGPEARQGRHARHATSRARTFRRVTGLGLALFGVLAVAALLTLVFVGISSPGKLLPGHGTGTTGTPPKATTAGHGAQGSPGATGATTATTPGATTPSPGAVTVAVGRTTWQLPAPIGDEVALAVPGSATQVEILGGMTTGNQRAQGIFTMNLSTGSLTQVGDLASSLADAAGALTGGRGTVFGGAAPTPSDAVQALASLAPGTASAPVIGTLPAPRSGAATAVVGTTTFLVGGEDGTAPEATVLATTDGRHFTAVATLHQPVADPAVAAVGSKLYVFGGIALSGPSAGKAVDTVQVVDTVARTSAAVGALPVPLAGASAVVLEGHVLVLGGDTNAGGTLGSIGTSATVWSYVPGTARSGSRAAAGTVHVAGHLFVPVARAGVAVVGNTAWIVGGDSDGAPVTTVQTVTPGSPGAAS